MSSSNSPPLDVELCRALQEEHADEDKHMRHGQSSRRAYFRELKKVGLLFV